MHPSHHAWQVCILSSQLLSVNSPDESRKRKLRLKLKLQQPSARGLMHPPPLPLQCGDAVAEQQPDTEALDLSSVMSNFQCYFSSTESCTQDKVRQSSGSLPVCCRRLLPEDVEETELSGRTNTLPYTVRSASLLSACEHDTD